MNIDRLDKRHISRGNLFVDGRRCPICGGDEEGHTDLGTFCDGLRLSDEKFACSREDFAGDLYRDQWSGHFAHTIGQVCPCGGEHIPGNPSKPNPWTKADTGPKPKVKPVTKAKTGAHADSKLRVVGGGDETDPAQVAQARTIIRLAKGQPVAEKTLLALGSRPFDWSGLANRLNSTPDVARRPGLVRQWVGNQTHLLADAAELLRRTFRQAETEPEADEEPEPEPRPRQIKIIGSLEFANTDYRMQWLIKRVLVADQPGVVAAPKKGMKTSTMVDLAVSLASGSPFLGTFDIPEAVPVLLLSGESGGFVIKDTVARVCRAKEIEGGIAGLEGRFFVGFELPQLSQAEQVEALSETIRTNGIKVVVIDPLYLCLLSASEGGRRLDAANLFDMGPLLLSISRACLDAGATPLLVHHFRKNVAEPYDLPELENMAFAGIQEFARQWIMLGRRKKFEPGSGLHELWLTVGGSAGHSGEWAVDVREGVMDDDFTGREWDVSVRPASEVRNEAAKACQETKVNRQVEQSRARDAAKGLKVQEDADRAYEALERMGRTTEKKWRLAMSWHADRLGSAITWLQGQNRIRPTQVPVACNGGVRNWPGWEPNLASWEAAPERPASPGIEPDGGQPW